MFRSVCKWKFAFSFSSEWKIESVNRKYLREFEEIREFFMKNWSLNQLRREKLQEEYVNRALRGLKLSNTLAGDLSLIFVIDWLFFHQSRYGHIQGLNQTQPGMPIIINANNECSGCHQISLFKKFSVLWILFSPESFEIRARTQNATLMLVDKKFLSFRFK